MLFLGKGNNSNKRKIMEHEIKPFGELALFSLGRGQTVITRNALDRLHPGDVLSSISRHACGGCGDCGTAYVDRNGLTFWIITEPARNVTTILLPEDYQQELAPQRGERGPA
jgi:hypothetical protein